MFQKSNNKIDSIKKLNELREIWEALPHYDEKSFQFGYRIAHCFIDSWNEDENPSKVYIKGRRVHHGSIGAVLSLIGIIYQAKEDSFVLGCAFALMEDDVEDMYEWFDFEKGGDHMKWISTV